MNEKCLPNVDNESATVNTHANDDSEETLVEVIPEEIFKLIPSRMSKRYTRELLIQLDIVNQSVERMKSIQEKADNDAIKQNSTKVAKTTVLLPLIFPKNSDVMPETMMLIHSLGLKLFERHVKNQRTNYRLMGRIEDK